MATTRADLEAKLPKEIRQLRAKVVELLGELRPSGKPRTTDEPRALMLSSRTDGGRSLPPYFLVYFLFVDFLGYENLGQWEKVAWIVPIRYEDRLYSIEHRKFGLGVFAPCLDPTARMSGKPTAEQEADAQEIAKLVRKAVTAAEPYFEWRAKEAASGIELNVTNNSDWLFERYEHFRDRFRALSEEAHRRKDEHEIRKKTLPDGTVMTSGSFPGYTFRRQAEWTAQAAIEAFFSWTEHAFIHLAILQGRLRTGDDISQAAGADWKSKFKSALDVNDPRTKKHYDVLLDLRGQIRNFMAHGAFGKDGQAFKFHSGAGAVPILLTDNPSHRYSLSGQKAFDEASAIDHIEAFISYLWSGALLPARQHLESGLASILTFVADGTYARAMSSVEAMGEFVEHWEREVDRAHNMDW